MGIFALTACQENITNEWFDASVQPLEVVSHETSFPASAASGKIVVNTTDPVTVEMEKIAPEGEMNYNEEWVTTTVNKNTITVDVTENKALEGRVKMLTIKAGTKKTQIAVIQGGYVFNLEGQPEIDTNDAGGTFDYTFRTTLDGTPEYRSSEWIKVTAEGKKLKVTLEPNATSKIRKGYFEAVLGEHVKRINVRQMEFDKDILGTYKLYYGSAATKFDDKVMNNVVLGKEGSTYYFTMTVGGNKMKVPVTVVNNAIFWQSGVHVGQYFYNNIDNFVHTIAVSSAYITWDKFTMGTDAFDLAEVNGKVVTQTTKFVDKGEWSGQTIAGFCLEFFSGTPPSSNNRQGINCGYFFNPRFVRVEQ